VSGRQLTLAEVAETLRLRTKTVAQCARRGELVGRRIGRRWIFAQEAVDAFLAEMPQWLYERQPRGLNGDSGPAARGEGDQGSSLKSPPTAGSKVQDAADKFFRQMREKAANKPRDPLEQTKPETSRVRGPDGRFEGPRRDVEDVPRLPTFPLRWVLEDPRRRPYFVVWTSGDDGLRYGLKMAPTDHPDTVLVTLESGEPYQIPIVRRPLPRGTGMALFYRCPWCRKPRRHIYLLTLVGAKLVDYLGLRCQVCAGLRFRSQGRYLSSFTRAFFAPLLEGQRTVAPFSAAPVGPASRVRPATCSRGTV